MIKFSHSSKPGVVANHNARYVTAPLATSSGIAAGVITVPVVIPAPGVHIDFAVTLGGCVCAGRKSLDAYCVSTPAPTTPAALAIAIAECFNTQPDIAGYFRFAAVGSTVTYTSVTPGMVVASWEMPSGFAHVASNTGLIACPEIKPGRAVVQNPCRVPTASNPHGVALPASSEAGDRFVGVSVDGSHCAPCGPVCGCPCFQYVSQGTIGIELAVPEPPCPATSPLNLAYSMTDGRFALYRGAAGAGYVGLPDLRFRVELVQGLSALITLL
jgi:hypothetical protein